MAVLSETRARRVIDGLAACEFDAYAACDAEGVDHDDWRAAVDASDELSARLKRRRREFAENKLMQRVAKGDRHAIEAVMNETEPDGEFEAAVAAFIRAMEEHA